MSRIQIRKKGKSHDYRQLWRVIDGALACALKHHPDYIRVGERKARDALVKRITGAVNGYLAEKTRSGASCPAGDKETARNAAAPKREAGWASRQAGRATHTRPALPSLASNANPNKETNHHG